MTAPQQAPVLQYNHDPRTLADEIMNQKIRDAAPALLEALIKAESALYYAKTEGTFDTPYTAQDVTNAHQTAADLLKQIFTEATRS